MQAYNAWKDDSTKTIINISSRASQPNISKGYLYAAQKASLNHLSNNLVYNSDKKCRITTLNLGLLQHQDLPCISYNEVAGWIYRHCTGSKHIDIPEMTFQHAENYQSVQSDKQALRELENFTK
jgi:NADP-dependent 3-hydroxy acid dehydrogenase YdfG